MSIFEYFWDRQAGLLIATCNLPRQADTGIVLVSRVRDGDLPEPIAVVPLRRCARNIATTFAIPAPKEGEPAGDRLEYCLVCEDGHDGEPLTTEQIVLDAVEGTGRAGVDSLNWSILEARDGPALDLSLPEDTVPANQLISRVLASRRDGDRLAPGSLGNGVGSGAAVMISAEWGAPAPLSDDPGAANADHVVRLSIRPVDAGTAMTPTIFRVHSLMAGSHACSMIGDPDHAVDPRSCNFAELRLTQQARQVHAEFPRSGAAADDHDAFPLGLLDRIVISSSPPALISHVEDADRARTVGRDGVAVLAFGHDGSFRSDEGVLLSRIIASVQAQQQTGATDLVAGLAEFGMTVSRTDLVNASDISVLLTAEAARDVGTRLPMLRPSGVAQFRSAPQFFVAVAALDRNRFPADVVARLAQTARLDTVEKCALLGRMLLERQIEQDEDNRGGWQASDQNRLQLWLESDRAAGLVILAVALSRRLQDVICGGIAPDWHEIGLVMSTPPDYLRDIERLLARLTRAGIVPFDAGAQFCTLSASRQQLRNLRQMGASVAAYLGQMNAMLADIADLPESDDAIVDMLSDMADAPDQTPRPLKTWLEEQLRPHLPDTLAQTPGHPLLARAVRILADGLRHHYDHVSNFVAAGFSNPVRPARGFAEPQVGSPSQRRIPTESIEWLLSEGHAPEVVAHWKISLRQEYESRGVRH